MNFDNSDALLSNTACDSALQLRHFLENQSETLLGTLEYYVRKANLTNDTVLEIREAAIELLNEVTVEALTNAGRFDTTRSPHAWLLGIAANLIKRRQVQNAKRRNREPLLRDMHELTHSDVNDDEIFDWLSKTATAGPEEYWEIKENTAAMLSLVSADDQKILRLAILNGMNGEELAQQLNISTGAARVRLHRAISRLSKAWRNLKQNGGGND